MVFHGTSFGVILLCVAIILICYAALHDVLMRIVPNWTSGIIFLLGVIFASGSGRLGTALLFGAGLFLILSLIWWLGLFGGGDVKLWSAGTLFVPPCWPAEWKAFSAILLAGGIIALIYILLRLARLRCSPVSCPRDLSLWRRSLRCEIRRIRKGGPLPYAVAICAGFLFTLVPILPGT